MSDRDSDSHIVPHVPGVRPFYPKALACFLISALCLAWMISLQMQSERLASVTNTAPARPPSKPAPAQAAPPKKPDVPAAPRQLTEADFAIAEIDVLKALAQHDEAVDFKRLANALRPYTYHTNTAVR